MTTWMMYTLLLSGLGWFLSGAVFCGWMQILTNHKFTLRDVLWCFLSGLAGPFIPLIMGIVFLVEEGNNIVLWAKKPKYNRYKVD